MNLPGENTITLSHTALAALVEGALNVGQPLSVRVRVTGVNRPSSFKDETEFQITTDTLPVPQGIVRIGPELLRKPAPAPEPLPTAADPLPVLQDDDRPF